MNPQTLPTRDEVVAVFTELIGEKKSRAEVSAWACRYFLDDDIVVNDMKVWDALKKLGSVDLVAPDRPYLYGVEDFERWLRELQENTDE